AQAVKAQVDQAYGPRWFLAEQSHGRLGEHHLTGMGRVQQSRRVEERRAAVNFVPRFDLAGVQRHAEAAADGPREARERPRAFDGGGQRLAGASERERQPLLALWQLAAAV